MSKGFAPILILVVIVVMVVVAGGAYYFGKSQNPTVISTPQVVSQPIISLTPSLSPTDETANWKTDCKNIINDPKTKYKECGIGSEYNLVDDKKMCEEIGGQYVCVSPCRHDPPGTMCIQICVPLCTFQ